MIKYLKATMPKGLSSIHHRLSIYFHERQDLLNIEGKAAFKNEIWRNFETERIYHLFNSQSKIREREAINTFLYAIRWRWEFAEKISITCQQVGVEIDSKSIQKTSNFSKLFSSL